MHPVSMGPSVVPLMGPIMPPMSMGPSVVPPMGPTMPPVGMVLSVAPPMGIMLPVMQPPVIFQSSTRSSSRSHGSPRSQHQQTPPAPQPPFIINTTEGQ